MSASKIAVKRIAGVFVIIIESAGVELASVCEGNETESKASPAHLLGVKQKQKNK